MATAFDHLFGAQAVCTVKDVKAEKFINSFAENEGKEQKLSDLDFEKVPVELYSLKDFLDF